MADELQSLTALLKAIAPSQAAQLDQLASAVAEAANENAWTQAVDAYRNHVKGQVKAFVPAPVLRLPGVEPLIDGLVTQALNQAESEVADLARQIDLGPVGAALNMQPAILTNPFNNTRRLLGIYPPTGLGVKFGTGPVSGGGSLDYQSTPNPRLSGSFGLKMGVFGVSALSLLQDSSNTYALTTLIAARFAPGIQLGFGFAVSGIGGLIGVNRTTNVNELQARFRTGALADALFGDDPIRNATSTLQTLSQVYVAQSGSHVFGPTMQLSWLKIGTLTFFNVDLGVFMQLPRLRVDILASARAEVPLVFRLRMDVHGEVDPARQLIGVSAALVDSHLMGIFRIMGEAFFRLHYGDHPYVVLTLGGFFPGFNPAPAVLPPNIQRIGMGLDLPVKLPLYFRAEGYFAVTTNTLQFGGLLETGIDVDLFSASGHLQLDAIFQFSPFKFAADFSAGFEVKVLGETFSGVRCDGKITGPGPFVIHARITYETPFFLPDIKWNDTFVFGQPKTEEPKVMNLLELLRPELTSLGNLRAESAEDRWVVLDSKATPDGKTPLLAPRGHLAWSQQRTPLQLSLIRFEGALLTREWNLAVESTPVAGETLGAAPTEQFSPGMFRQLSDAEKLNLPKFEAHASGLRLHFVDLLAPGPIDHLVKYDVHYEPPRTTTIVPGYFFSYKNALLSKVLSKHNSPTVANLDATMKIKPETWQVGSQTFTTHLAAHVAAQSTGGVAHLANDTINLGGV
jgi:hypothetical protein